MGGGGDYSTKLYTQSFLRSYNNSSSGVNLSPYSGVIFGGSYFNSKKEFEELFVRCKNHPRY